MMQLTSRRRIVLLLMIACIVGFYYITWALQLGRNIVRSSRSGIVVCSGSSWQDFGNGDCGGFFGAGFSPMVGIVELVVVSALLLLIGWLLARWALRPVRTMADTVARLGPTSLGLRLNPIGPREETRLLAEAIDAMLGRVAEGYDAQQRFAANASHELRTPLATQRALIEVSLTSALTPDQLELLSRQLLSTNERNERLVEGLLVLAETDRGLLGHSPQRLDLITAAAVETARPSAEERGLRLCAALDPVSVPGEQPLLERLVGNLLQNAVKYNVPGGRIDVAVRPDGCLRVANTGPPVPADEVSGLFEPFRRASGERLQHGGGVGLGLTIARSVVAAHHGDIRAWENPGGGLIVEVRLPTA